MNSDKRIQRNLVIINDYNEGMKISEIAKKHDLSEVSISKVIRAGRMIGQVTASRRNGSTERDNDIAIMYESGMSMQAIADKYNLSRERVRQILSSRKVRSRSVSEANKAAYDKWAAGNAAKVNEIFDETRSIRKTIDAMPGHHPSWVRQILTPRSHEVVRTNTVEKYWTEERLLAVLVSASDGGSLSIKKYQEWRTSGVKFEGRTPPTHAVIIWQFDTWNNALERAGLSSARHNGRVYKRTWSTEDAYAAVRAYSLHSMSEGKRPTCAGYDGWSDSNPGHPSSTYIRVLTRKSWAEAVRAAMKTA